MDLSEDFQYYPTPKSLAIKAWSKFQDKSFSRVLEPSAGEGHLACTEFMSRHRKPPVDCIEIDITKHARLKEQGHEVVGIDFLSFENAAMYSHIIMNPPFLLGTQHLLKAWEVMYDGEIVCILNAETIRNPYTKERQLLNQLIAQCGEVEFITEAFMDKDAVRKTEVEIALVYLRKESNFAFDLAGNILDQLKEDKTTKDNVGDDYRELNDIAITNSSIENAVAAFNAANIAIRESVFAEARAKHYLSIIGDSLERMNGNGPVTNLDASLETVRKELYERYKDLKNRAWANILRSTQVTNRLSSSAQKRMESEFETIKKLEFTTSNIYGFLSGLSQSQGEIQINMLCDIFDSIVRYHDENTVHYMGWSSNTKHRTCGMRIKMTRFILPNNDAYSSSLSWNSMQRLRDFDKGFAMLDGKTEPEVSLENVFDKYFKELRSGERISSTYFDVRYYRGIGTIHFFPRKKELIDRLNRLVGAHRQWLPPTDKPVSDEFWLQYEAAEKHDKELRNEVKKSPFNSWSSPFYGLHSTRIENVEEAQAIISEAMVSVLERRGYRIDNLLSAPEQLLLTA